MKPEDPPRKFKRGDVVVWDMEYENANTLPEKLGNGPFVVISSRKYRPMHNQDSCPEYVVSVADIQTGTEPRHTYQNRNGGTAFRNNNNWDDRFFKKDEFLTEVHRTGKRISAAAKGKSDLRP